MTGGSAGPRPLAEILAALERLLAARQELALRREALGGRRDPAAARERAALDGDLAAQRVALDRLLAELGMREPPDGRPPDEDDPLPIGPRGG